MYIKRGNNTLESRAISRILACLFNTNAKIKCLKNMLLHNVYDFLFAIRNVLSVFRCCLAQLYARLNINEYKRNETQQSNNRLQCAIYLNVLNC